MPSISGQAASPDNPFLLAADNSPRLLPLLRSNPALASNQDNSGYSLLHAAASYNFLDLARSLRDEFNVNPNIVDEDGETALFVVESVEAAQCLLDDIGTSLDIRNVEGMTAEEKIRGEGDFVTIADYLKEVRLRRPSEDNGVTNSGVIHEASNGAGEEAPPPPLPPGVRLRVGSLEAEENLGEVADPELRRRIEELAAREDFQGEEAQLQLRELVAEAVRGANTETREVRPRHG